MIKNLYNFLTVAVATVSLLLTGCNDETSQIGESISGSEVMISVDSLTYSLEAKCINAPELESMSAYSLLGSINVPEYGNLHCSYVTEFLPSETLSIPDSISPADVDSVKLVLTVPKLYITGDSLAPQQLKVYSLSKRIPSGLTSSFNPEEYYSPSDLLSTKSYTLSGYAYGDTTYQSSSNINVEARLPLSLGKEMLEKYRENPELFVWPQEFAGYWPGVYVTPSFGKGCVSPVVKSSVYLYYPMTKEVYESQEDGKEILQYVTVADSVCVLTSAPEVVSSVKIDYSPSENLSNLISQGKQLITTPGGYTVSFKFPAKQILEKYWDTKYDLGVINNLVFTLPAKPISNSYGIGLPPALVMVKTSELESFFSYGRLPDNSNSFYSILDTDSNTYSFTSMRQYIVDLKNKGEENITDEDTDFTLIPVVVNTEDYTDTSTGKLVTVVTSVVPYILKPTMAEIDTENAGIVFTYSNEILQ